MSDKLTPMTEAEAIAYVDRLRADLNAAHTMLADARAQLAERDERLARIAATTQSLLPALDKVDVATMDASSGIRKLFIQSRMVIGLVEAIAKGETT